MTNPTRETSAGPPTRPPPPAALILRLIEPPAAVPERWRGPLRLLAGVLLPLVGLSLAAAIVLPLLAATGTPVNPGSLFSSISAFLVLLAAYAFTRAGRYLPAAVLTVAVTLMGILAPALAEPQVLSTDPLITAYLVIPIVLGGLLLPPRYAGALAVLVLALAAGLLTVYTAGQPLTKLSVLVLLAAVSGMVVVGAAIRERDAARIADQGAALRESNAQLTGWLAAVEQRTSEMVVLNELGEMLQACATPAEALNIVADAARQLFPGQPGAICMQSASRTSVAVSVAWGPPLNSAHAFAPEDCWALRLGRAHTSPPHDTGRRCRHLPPAEAAHLCVPLLAQGEALGVLHVALPGPADTVETRRRLAQTIADNIALALANLRLRETLRSQSIRDPLTGLYNRRYLEETLERELRRAERSQRPLGVIMLDLDHFKDFNDTFGHGAGDAALRALGAFIQRHIRASDIACRLGGEEFVILLPEAALEVVQERTAALRAGLEQLAVPYGDQHLGPLEFSAGLALFPHHALTGEALLKAADGALYQAKRAGRNRVEVAGAAPAAPALRGGSTPY